jgi:hypothetical protein
VSTWAIPALPVRVNAACSSSHPRVSVTAAWCAASTAARVSSSPSAHSKDTLFTGVNTRSYPATGRRPAASGWCRNGTPSRVAAIASRSVAPVARSSIRIRSLSGCRPRPNRASICASVTVPDTPSSRHPEPSHRPGGFPVAV